jgi:6-phosphogluconolactonase
MVERRSFDARDELAKALADAVSADIAAAIAADGHAFIAVSGGSTPAKFFSALGKRKTVEWDKVTVTLVDERWVDETSSRSNANLVNEKMLQGPAASAKFLPLYTGGDEPDLTAIATTNASLAGLPHEFASVILGMGNDGHTASFFPGGDTFDEALSNPGPALAIRAPGAGEPRVTLTLPRLLQTRSLYIHIEGDEKAEVLEKALGEGAVDDMPVRAVLRQTDKPVIVYWAP